MAVLLGCEWVVEWVNAWTPWLSAAAQTRLMWRTPRIQTPVMGICQGVRCLDQSYQGQSARAELTCRYIDTGAPWDQETVNKNASAWIGMGRWPLPIERSAQPGR